MKWFFFGEMKLPPKPPPSPKRSSGSNRIRHTILRCSKPWCIRRSAALLSHASVNPTWTVEARKKQYFLRQRWVWSWKYIFVCFKFIQQQQHNGWEHLSVFPSEQREERNVALRRPKKTTTAKTAASEDEEWNDIWAVKTRQCAFFRVSLFLVLFFTLLFRSCNFRPSKDVFLPILFVTFSPSTLPLYIIYIVSKSSKLDSCVTNFREKSRRGRGWKKINLKKKQSRIVFVTTLWHRIKCQVSRMEWKVPDVGHIDWITYERKNRKKKIILNNRSISTIVSKSIRANILDSIVSRWGREYCFTDFEACRRLNCHPKLFAAAAASELIIL